MPTFRAMILWARQPAGCRIYWRKNWKNGKYIIPRAAQEGSRIREIAVDIILPALIMKGLCSLDAFRKSYFEFLGGARLAWSDDGCKSWSKIVSLTNEGISEFTQVKTGMNGEVIVTFSTPDFKISGGNHVMLVRKTGENFYEISPCVIRRYR